MVYDLGGGTFDVTVANVKGLNVDVITSRGDKYLGGRDFDNKIVEILSKKYKKQTEDYEKETSGGYQLANLTRKDLET